MIATLEGIANTAEQVTLFIGTVISDIVTFGFTLIEGIIAEIREIVILIGMIIQTLIDFAIDLLNSPIVRYFSEAFFI
jgi:hypothetical protein